MMISREISVDIEISPICYDCNDDLEFVDVRGLLQIKPCLRCMKDQYELGLAEDKT